MRPAYLSGRVPAGNSAVICLTAYSSASVLRGGNLTGAFLLFGRAGPYTCSSSSDESLFPALVSSSPPPRLPSSNFSLSVSVTLSTKALFLSSSAMLNSGFILNFLHGFSLPPLVVSILPCAARLISWSIPNIVGTA